MNIILSDLQNKAMKLIRDWYTTFNVKRKPYYVLAGIAGSGKTSIVNYLLEEMNIENAVTVAYTGMAASVLMRKGNKNSSTFHRLVYNTKVIEDEETKKKKFITELKSKEELEMIDLIIVDEYSMLPDNLIDDVLSFNKPVLFLGDPLQLPPIYGENRLKYDFFLDEPHRQALDNPILAIANYARTQQFDKIKIGTYGDKVRVFSSIDFDEESLLNSDQIICCKNKTVNSMNKFIRNEYLGYKDNMIRENEKIMCIANNWGVTNKDGLSLVNGLIGNATQVSIKPKAQFYEVDFTPAFTDTFESVIIDKLKFENKESNSTVDLFRSPILETVVKANEFVYGYAITCHKSQGSEFPYVTFMPEVLSKKDYHKIFYTGVTRASEKLDIIL